MSKDNRQWCPLSPCSLVFEFSGKVSQEVIGTLTHWYFDTVVRTSTELSWFSWAALPLSLPVLSTIHISIHLCNLCSENTGGNNRSPGFTVWLSTDSCFLEFSLKQFLCYNKFLIFIINQWTWKKLNIWIWATFRISVKIVWLLAWCMSASWVGLHRCTRNPFCFFPCLLILP